MAKPGGGVIDELFGATFWHFAGWWQWYVRVFVLLYLRAVAITGFALAKGEVVVARVLHRSMTLPKLSRFCTKQKTDCGA